MRTFLKENSLDWAITHLCRYCDSDLFPRMFEFEAIRQNWGEVKVHLLSINLEAYVPQPPLLRFAPKVSGVHRVVHRLDPIDSLIYTALVHELHGAVEGARDPQTEQIASARVEPATDGSFFSTVRNAWQHHTERIERLAAEHKDGYVLMADIGNFFGQIQPRLLGQLLAESRGTHADLARVLSRFLSSLCTASDRGIPVGPAASTVLSEAILASVDREILNYTGDFARWADDLRLFFDTEQDAQKALLGLSEYIHKAHEMMFAAEKTRVVPVRNFLERFFKGRPDETLAAGPAEMRLSALVHESSIVAPHYGWMTSTAAQPRPNSVYVQMQALPEYQTAGSVYAVHFNKAVTGDPPDLLAARRIMRKAAAYRIRTLLPGVINHFEMLTPVIRETATYLKAMLVEEDIRTYAAQLSHAWTNQQHGSSYINDWMCHVFTNPGFNQIDLPAEYSAALGVRNQAMIARRKQDVEWVRRYTAHMDELDPWDRRAVLYASSVLPQSERASAVAAAQARGEIVERSIARYLESISAKSPDNYPSYGDKAAAKGPDNYPSYGDKSAGKAPDNYPSYGDKAAAKGPDNYPSYGDKSADKAPDN